MILGVGVAVGDGVTKHPRSGHLSENKDNDNDNDNLSTWKTKWAILPSFNFLLNVSCRESFITSSVGPWTCHMARLSRMRTAGERQNNK